MSLFEEALNMLQDARRRVPAWLDDGEAIDELIVEAVKRLEAEWGALMCEIEEASRG